MIVNDQCSARLLFSSAFALTVLLAAAPQASAETPIATTTTASAPSAATDVAARSIVLVDDGSETSTTTSATTVGAFLRERGVVVRTGDFLSAPSNAPVVDGMQIVHRRGVPVTLVVGRERRLVRTGAATVGDLLSEQHVRVSKHDEVEPRTDRALPARGTVAVTRIQRWTSIVDERTQPRLQRRFSRTLALGKTTTLAAGSPGVRVATVRYERRNGAAPTKTISYRVVRAGSPRVVVSGLAPESSLAHIAVQGFTGVLRFAGAALHVIATAYTAGCYKCSGFTASGVRAGQGIIAVDPRVIPLGTRLFVPGYGRAVAGDTGGAIVGNRVDLGFDRVADALQYGRRAVTVYVVK